MGELEQATADLEATIAANAPRIYWGHRDGFRPLGMTETEAYDWDLGEEL